MRKNNVTRTLGIVLLVIAAITGLGALAMRDQISRHKRDLVNSHAFRRFTALAYLACRYIVTSRAGRVVAAVRDAESRTRFLGYRVESYKLWVFVFSAVLAGVAGALYVPQVGIINPSEFSPLNSIELVIWVAIGGRGTLYGAVAGAFIVNFAKTYFTTALPSAWLYFLGALFVVTTLVLPRGFVGLLDKVRTRPGLAAGGTAAAKGPA
jgi:urea ABC transporter permease protein UrtC